MNQALPDQALLHVSGHQLFVEYGKQSLTLSSTTMLRFFDGRAEVVREVGNGGWYLLVILNRRGIRIRCLCFKRSMGTEARVWSKRFHWEKFGRALEGCIVCSFQKPAALQKEVNTEDFDLSATPTNSTTIPFTRSRPRFSVRDLRARDEKRIAREERRCA